jgi:two-component sensor histidine kinase
MIFYKDEALYNRIINSTKNHKMIFIGENPHWDKAIDNTVEQLMIELAKETSFRVYARESLYCCFPFMESDSLNARESRLISSKITEYNKANTFDKRIIATAVDIAHSIKHSTQLVDSFIQRQLRAISKASIKEQLISLSQRIAAMNLLMTKRK